MATQVPEKVMKLLQKLQALANCPTGNVNETAAAAARMSEIMLEHGIESICAAPQVLQKHLALDKQVPVWQQTLLAVLARAVGCSPLRVEGKELWLIGDLGVAQAVDYQFKALVKDLECQFRAYSGATSYRRPQGKEYNSFGMGALQEIAARLREMKQKTVERVRQQGTQTQALVWLDKGPSDSDVLAAMGMGEGTRLVNKTRRRQRVNADAYTSGREAGRQVPLGSQASGALGGERIPLR